MRIVAGTAGGLRLQTPSATVTRPTTDKVREAVFNSLNSFGAIEGSAILDLFAGTGACGIEALSRGAASCTFVDSDRRAASVIKMNLQLTGFQGPVIRADAMAFLEDAPPFDVAFVDPPYAFDQWNKLLSRLRAGLVVCESNRQLPPPPGWTELRERSYGETVVTMFSIEALPHRTNQ